MKGLSYVFLYILIGIFLFKNTQAQILTESNLPILLVNTNGTIIQDEPKVRAILEVIDNPGQKNAISDLPTSTHYIGIEIRGASSQGFDKKSFGVESHDSLGVDIDIRLLGLPEEEDWIFHGPFADKTLIRNALSMHISRALGNYASDFRFFELVINGDYQGVYLLMEKIKRDKNRVDIAKLRPEDIADEELTGGYILKFDWPGENEDENEGWESNFETVREYPLFFHYVYPKYFEIKNPQKEYIQSYIQDFENALFNPNFTNKKGLRYDSYIDVNSFIDFFIVNELSKNVDAYKLSSFLHKDKSGPLKAGPVWDFNIAWYNSDYCAGADYQDWIFNEEDCEDLELMPRWWERFWADIQFREQLKSRWNERRKDVLSRDNIFHFIDSLTSMLDLAQKRNYQRWEVIEESTWAHPEIPGSYESEVSNLKRFITDRLNWIDDQFCESCIPIIDTELVVYPNPTSEKIYFGGCDQLPADSYIILHDLLGRELIREENPKNTCSIDVSNLRQGTYLITLYLPDEIITKKIWVLP